MNALPAIDALSIALFIGLISTVLAAGMLMLWRWERTHHGFGFWAAGTAVFASGMMMLLAREIAPLWISIVLGNAGVFAAFVLMRAGFQRFRARSLSIAPDAALTIASVVALLFLWTLGIGVDERIALAATTFGVLALRCAVVLAGPAPGVGLVFRALQTVFATIALLACARAALALFVDSPSSSLFDARGTQTLVYLALGIAAILLPFLLLLLNSLRNLDRLRTAQAEAETAATTDYLTGLANRRLLFRALESMSPETTLAVCLIDLDDFKRVNDEHGHSTGDRVLAQLGRIFRELVADDEIAVRLGGEEFAILSRGDSHFRATRLAGMLRETVENELGTRGGLSGHVTCSIGVAEGRAGDMDTVLGRADHALYEAKRRGKNRVVVFDGVAGGEPGNGHQRSVRGRRRAG